MQASPAATRIKNKVRVRTRLRGTRGAAWLVASPLFDVDWYAMQAGCSPSRQAAALHYLSVGRRRGLSPHPLFWPAHYRGQLPASDRLTAVEAIFRTRAADPRYSPHPLFDAELYAAENPEARHHEFGLLGHYVTQGAAAARRPNDWYRPDLHTQPRGLVDWVVAKQLEWSERAADVPRLASSPPPDGRIPASSGAAAPPPVEEADVPAVSVLMALVGDPAQAHAAIESVKAQEYKAWELLVATGDQAGLTSALAGGDARIRVVAAHADSQARAWNAGVEAAQGRYLAWITPDAQWAPGHLAAAVAALAQPGCLAVHAVTAHQGPYRAGGARSAGRRRRSELNGFSAQEATPARLAAGLRVPLSSLVVDRLLAVAVGGFDEGLLGAADHDFILKVAGRTPLELLRSIGVTLREVPSRRDPDVARHLPALDESALDTWHDVVLSRQCIDWPALERAPREQSRVSVIIPTYRDFELTTQAVQCVAESRSESTSDIEVIVVDNGCDAMTSGVLDALAERFPLTRVVHLPVNHGFALANNMALTYATGSVVVFLNNDTEVRPNWLGPLVEALEDPSVLAAQSLLVYPTGTVQSAGIAFPTCGGIPHVLLQRFPVEDAQGLEDADFSALTGAALAVRFLDVVGLRGFDPIFRNGMEDVDFGLRLKQLRPGRLSVRPESVVIHHESRTPGRFARAEQNRQVLLARWRNRMPGDDERLWRRAGFEVLGHEVAVSGSGDPRVVAPVPVLAQSRPRLAVHERPPLFRWAIKNPAPAGDSAEIWGDTHYARALARGLRSLGQHVAIDHREEFERPSGRFDDVVLVLRGLAPYRPRYGAVNLCWLISHPDIFERSEAEAFDRVFAASSTWAEEMSRRWGLRIDPLLQATDPELFHPDRAAPDTGHEVLFVGGSRRVLRPMVQHAVDSGLPLSVFGREWEGLIPEANIRGWRIPNEDVGVVYRAAGVVLNDHWEDMRREGFISNRLFDAAAAGARVVTDDVAGLGDVFGRSVQVASSPVELKRLVEAADWDEVFGDDEERRRVAARIHAEHSFEARARQLLAVATEEYCRMSESRRCERWEQE